MHITHGQNWIGMRMNHVVCMTVIFAALMSAHAGNVANPDAVELAPLPVPVEFSRDMDAPVAFDASASVSVSCPDAEAVAWLSRHFAEWYGDQTPKVIAAADGDIRRCTTPLLARRCASWGRT